MFVKRFTLGSAVALTLLVVLAAGCDKDIAFYIYQNQVPDEGCVVSADTGSLYRPTGLLDVSLGRGYELFPLVLNELPSLKELGSAYSEDADPNTLHLREFRVKLDIGAIKQNVSSKLLTFPFPTSGTLEPGDKRASRVRVIPDDLVRELDLPSGARPTIIAEVRAIADSDDGEVESLPFFYPIELCEGCLVVTLDSCPTDREISNDNNVCRLPQDAPLVCCQDPELGLVCP